MIEGIIGMIGAEEREHDSSVHAHYGMTQEEFFGIKKDVFMLLLTSDTWTDTIDKIFSGADTELRAKVFAFATAFSDYVKVREELSRYSACKCSRCAPEVNSDESRS